MKYISILNYKGRLIDKSVHFDDVGKLKPRLLFLVLWYSFRSYYIFIISFN